MPSITCGPDWTVLLPPRLRLPIRLGYLAVLAALYVHRRRQGLGTPASSSTADNLTS
jgi:hypothetical protein